MGDWAAAEQTASQQFGGITRHQLVSSGIAAAGIHWAIKAGRLEHLLPGAYRFRTVPESPLQLAHAVARTVGEPLVFSHESARTLWRLRGAAVVLTTPLHVTLPNTKRIRLPDTFHVHYSRRPPKPYELNGLRTTRIARTIIDLARSLNALQLEELLDATHLRFRRLEHWLREELTDDREFRGRDALERLLSVRDGQQVESPFEGHVRQALRGSTSERYRTQFNVSDSAGFISRVDFAWPDQRVALLCDSYQWHSSRRQFDLDASQRARLAALEWLCIPITWTMRDDPIWQTQLAQALRRRKHSEFATTVWGAPE